MTINPQFWGWSTSPLTVHFWGWEQAEDIGVIFAYRGSKVVHTSIIASTVVRHDLTSKVVPILFTPHAIKWEPMAKVVRFDHVPVRSSLISTTSQAIKIDRVPRIVHSEHIGKVLRRDNTGVVHIVSQGGKVVK